MDNEQRNFLIAAVGLLLLWMLYDAVFLADARERRREEQEAAIVAAQEQLADPDLPVSTLEGGSLILDRDEALSNAQRIEIDTPSVAGSFALTGARFDDINLKRHFVELNSDERVHLLNPIGSEDVTYARDGWQSATQGFNDLPGSATEWQLVSGNRLTPDTPVTLSYTSGSGLDFVRTIAVDENYLITVTDEVTNGSGQEVELQRYGLVRREGLPADMVNNISAFEGAIAIVDDTMTRLKFNALADGREEDVSGEGGWAGITTRYWMAAVIPPQGSSITARFRTIDRADEPAFEASYVQRTQVLAAGQTLSSTGYIFAGANELDVLRHIQNDIGIAKFDMAINWGWLWFLVRPFVDVLNWLAGLTGNFGVAILLFTLGIKILMFPLANRSYASMARMKIVQPKMQEIRERHKDDPQAQQKAMMELYQKEKINPLAGCLPILPQIPIFFALFQTLFISLEMRHAPFFGWIQDMSAPDPTNMWNLFGLLPYDPSGIPLIGGILGLGAWPLIMGITMWAQQALNPPPPDPVQRQIFAFLPIVFTFVLAGFPAGLVIYWAWNNTLTVAQQYVIMRRNGNETQLDKLIARLMKRGEAES